MTIRGELLIGGTAKRGEAGTLHATNPATGEQMEPAFGGATRDDLDRACALADAAFDTYRETSLEQRAAFLEAIADNLLAVGDELVERTMAETGLPRGRLEGERGRTVGQLRMFAKVVRDGGFLDARIDPPLPDRQPAPRVSLRLRNIALGPVAVFGASNFPLAFSVAGGDTASALAAGCPVVVKAHRAHPGASEIAGRAIQKAVRDAGLPEGVFSLLFDSGQDISRALVADPRIKAVGFTGSRGGGMAFMEIAQARPEPIPVYAEMSSINPVVLFPNALATRGEAIGKAFAASLALGAGQFCTNPGLVIAVEGEGLDRFLAGAAAALAATPAATMLTPGIHKAYVAGVAAAGGHPAVETVARGQPGQGFQGEARLHSTNAEAFLRHPELQDEIFGAASLVVRCPDLDGVRRALERIEGQLTIALHVDDADLASAGALMPLIERKAGRILFNGFGTGVEVGHAMVHGGPFPSTSDGRSTSVGSLAIMRFLRPVCYQDIPSALIPAAVRDENTLGIPRRIDGKLELPA